MNGRAGCDLDLGVPDLDMEGAKSIREGGVIQRYCTNIGGRGSVLCRPGEDIRRHSWIESVGWDQ